MTLTAEQTQHLLTKAIQDEAFGRPWCAMPGPPLPWNCS